MILKKWNYETNQYYDYEIPNDWKCKIYSEDLEAIINCPHCGKKIKYGDSFTSFEFHNQFGMGYGVCDECYQEELDKRYSDYKKEHEDE